MKRAFINLLAVALASLGGAHQAHADFLVDWSYSWARNPAIIVTGTGGITLTDEPSVTASGPSDIVATNLRTFSDADPNTPDTITDGRYTLKVTIKDLASGDSNSLDFTGTLSGSFSKSSANVSNTFTGQTTQVLTLGNATKGFNAYTVTIGPYTPPGPPTASNAGSISAHVNVHPGPGPVEPPPHTTPEPTSLLLAGLGLSTLGLSASRRWLRRRA